MDGKVEVDSIVEWYCRIVEPSLPTGPGTSATYCNGGRLSGGLPKERERKKVTNPPLAISLSAVLVPELGEGQRAPTSSTGWKERERERFFTLSSSSLPPLSPPLFPFSSPIPFILLSSLLSARPSPLPNPRNPREPSPRLSRPPPTTKAPSSALVPPRSDQTEPFHPIPHPIRYGRLATLVAFSVPEYPIYAVFHCYGYSDNGLQELHSVVYRALPPPPLPTLLHPATHHTLLLTLRRNLLDRLSLPPSSLPHTQTERVLLTLSLLLNRPLTFCSPPSSPGGGGGVHVLGRVSPG